MEEEIFEILAAVLPETLEGWLGFAFLACALVSLVIPEPSETAHPLWKAGYRLISICGLGAGKLRAAGRLGKIGSIFRRRK